MPTIDNTWDNYLNALRLLVRNPSGKYNKPDEHELLALNMSAIRVSNKLGGLRVIVDSPTVADQSEYILDNNIIHVDHPAYLVTLVGVSLATEDTSELVNVVGYDKFKAIKNRGFFGSKHAFYSRSMGNRLNIEPAPAAGKIIRLLCKAHVTAGTLGTAQLYDGDIDQINAVVEGAAHLLRIGSRDVREADMHRRNSSESIEDAAQSMSRANQVDTIVPRQSSPLSDIEDF